jgi:hypothetical protein
MTLEELLVVQGVGAGDSLATQKMHELAHRLREMPAYRTTVLELLRLYELRLYIYALEARLEQEPNPDDARMLVLTYVGKLARIAAACRLKEGHEVGIGVVWRRPSPFWVQQEGCEPFQLCGFPEWAEPRGW